MRSVLILSVLFSALIAITIADETAEEHAKHHGISEDKMKIVNECKEQEKATDDDFQAFLSHKLQQTSTGKCLMACIYEKIGGIKDGKIDGSTIKEALLSDIGDEFINDAMNECQSVSAPDRCELAAQFEECVHKSLAAHHDSNVAKKDK